MSNAYRNTSVPVARSQEAIRRLLLNFGARGVQFSEDFQDRAINIKFARDHKGQLLTVSVTAKSPEPAKPKRARQRNYHYYRGKIVFNKTETDRQEQMMRATYRVMHDWLKSQFVAIEFGLMSFEDVFLSHFEWMIGNKVTTIGKVIQAHLENPQLLLNPGVAENVVDVEYKEV